MKRDYIKYEDLSAEIRKAIEDYHREKLKNRPDAELEASLEEWFDSEFDIWLSKRFLKGDEDNIRKHFRLDVELPVRVVETLLESSNEDTDARDFIGHIINISRGGLYFKLNRAIEVSSIIRVIINLGEIDTDLSDVEALAMVVRTDQIDENSFGIGVMFSSIYDHCRNNLDIFILKKLAYYIYN